MVTRINHATNVSIVDTALYLIPVICEVPLTFGVGTVNSVTCARAAVTVQTSDGRFATGWGEVPLNGQWAWPAAPRTINRDAEMRRFCIELTGRLRRFRHHGHPFELSFTFMNAELAGVMRDFDGGRTGNERIPTLAATVCLSAFDLALYDAFGRVHGVPVIATLGPAWMNRDLGEYCDPAAPSPLAGRYPVDFLSARPEVRLAVWHLVGYSDELHESVTSTAANASCVPGFADHPAGGTPPSSLDRWIFRDGIRLVKIKLMGKDVSADVERVAAVHRVASPLGVEALALDLNATAPDAGYVHDLFDGLQSSSTAAFDAVLYVEEPLDHRFWCDPTTIAPLARRKPLFMDECAQSWEHVREGFQAGWTGVALKTCKTLTGSLLSLAWARVHGMPVMVQDLSNPMLAQLTHLWFAAHAGTLRGVESNSMQFYPAASDAEARVHPGAYRRMNGAVDISTLTGPGFGYRLEEINRILPACAA